MIQVSSSKGSDGHTLALSRDGKVYSWGDGMLNYFPGYFIIRCLSMPVFFFCFSICVTFVTCVSQLIYFNTLLIPFLGDYGKLGHGNTLMQKVPKIIHGTFRNKVNNFLFVVIIGKI